MNVQNVVMTLQEDQDSTLRVSERSEEDIRAALADRFVLPKYRLPPSWLNEWQMYGTSIVVHCRDLLGLLLILDNGHTPWTRKTCIILNPRGLRLAWNSQL